MRCKTCVYNRGQIRQIFFWVVFVGALNLNVDSYRSENYSITNNTEVSSTYSHNRVINKNNFGLEHNSYVFRFKHSLYNVTIPENSVGKTYALQLPDEEKVGIKVIPNLDVKYRIVNGDRDKLFKAEERLVGGFAFLAIRTRTSNIILNREKTEEYRLTVKAFGTQIESNGKHMYESETMVYLRVLDRNDLSPLFYPTEYSKTLPEDMSLHTSILQVNAEDADLGINGEIYYSFLHENDNFAVHPTSGVITLTRRLKFLEKTIHELIVLANDRVSASTHRLNQASKAKVTIKVEPVNLYGPDIYVRTLPFVEENANANIYGIIRVTDKDQGIHGEIKGVELVSGDPDGHFRLTPTDKKGEYYIEIHKLLDREQTPQGYNLTFRADDRGIPPQSSYKTVPVHISDANDNSPVFNRQIYEVSVPETSPPNTPVIRLKVTDRDEGRNSQVFLEIVGGNEGGEFRINPDTGMLYTQKNLDAETKAFYTLTVSAIDQGNVGMRKQSSAKVKINVQDTNDNDPIFDIKNNTVWIDENEPAGTTVLKISARDKDSGENAYISYSIANLNEVPFDIDHFSGILRTSKLIDYETMRREYVLSVRASDWGLPFRRQTEIEILVKIKDVNDNRPQFERIDCIGHIPRQTPVGMDILTLSAIDFDSGNFITYRLVSGNEDGCFNLDQTSGVMSIGCDLSDVGIPQREVNVTATDGTHFADIMTIQINLIDEKRSFFMNSGAGAIFGRSIPSQDGGSFECRDTGIARRQAEILAAAEKNNMPGREYNIQDDFAMMPIRYGENVHAPEFVDFPLELKINETVELGETVAWIKARDRDLGYNGKLVYGISGGDSVFRIDPDTGELKIIGYLDRERQDEYVLNITVYDLGKPQKSSSKMFPITVLDQNDNPPKFEKSLASFRVTEQAKNGTIIFHLKATDADIGDNAKITYTLVTDTNYFQVEPETGILHVSHPLDREAKEVFELQIRATDNGSPTPLSADAVVLIIVDDVNDNAPEFSLAEYTFRVREDIPKGTVIAIVSATDADIGAGGEILYTFSDENYSEEKLFKIDKYTGTIRTQGYLNFEERQVHSLCVRAIDRGTPALSSEATVIIEIIDVNENRFAPEFEDFILVGSVLENRPANTHVMNVVATDADPVGPDSRVTYSIRGGDGLGIFSIDNDGSLRTMSLLDIESKPHYWLTVCAQDQAVVPLHSCVEVFIEVKNENDNVPLTDSPVYYPSVLEGSPPGVEVLQLKAADHDIDPDQHITYRIISGNPEGFFAINSTTGVISTTARKLDRENQPEHIMEILITDGGVPPLSSTTRVIVSVDDINDQSPEFDQRFYKVQIPATVKIDKPLFQVLAIDNDAGENGRVTYGIKSGKGKAKFRIDPDTGIIFAAKPFEPDTEYELAIRAEDNGEPKRMHVIHVNVIVVPVPEKSQHPPVIKSLNQEVDVTESDRPGFLVTVIQASDEDNDQLWFDIISGDPRNEFYIGRDNGNILLTKSLDWEVEKNYNITIAVTDGAHIVTTQLFVRVIDINDHRPEFTDSVYRINISENIDEESEILQLHATDMDEDKKIFYTLHAAQNPMSLTLFRIDSITGNVIVTQRLDRERLAEHVLVVIAKDQGIPAKRNYAKIIITVHDHNDHHPEFTTKIVQGKVFESAAIGAKVAQLYAIDRDFGDNAKITYSIVSGNIGNVFDIDSMMGIISVNKDLDINSMPEYMLQVKASDHGKPSLSSQIPVHIIITMAENDPPRFIKEQVSVEIYENRPIGTCVVQIEARSTSSISYEIVDGNSGDVFEINPSTGVITTKDVVDYEKVKLVNLTIRATNMASISSQSSAIIHILDQNDNSPHFLQNNYWGEISESAPIASLILSKDKGNVTDFKSNNQSFASAKYSANSQIQFNLIANQSPLVIKAVDLDSGLNALLRYDIVENMPKRYFHIDSTTGAIKTVMLLDYEQFPLFDFHVKVTDLGTPKLSSDITTRVQITVTNVNDCAPIFEQNEYNITLLLPTYENVVVIQVNATDPDGAEISKIRYDIIEGNEANAFAMDAETGIVTTRDVERIEPFYKLHVRASDGKYSKVAYVNINVQTSENYGLYFKKATYEGVISENSTKITTIATVNVLGSKLNEHIEYRILNPTKLFRIGLTSGAIESTGQVFDREVCDNYELIVEARSQAHLDGKSRIAHVVVNVTILDINDNCPMFVNLPYYAVVSVDDPKGSFVTKVHAVDLDSLENGEVRYEMKRGHGELFKVDRKTGDVTLKQSLEGHNRDYELLIAAYDGGLTPCSTEVGVYVKVIDKSMPVFSKQFYSVSVSENIEIYTPLSVTIQADSPLGRKLIYTIAKGNEMEEFALDFNTGTITVADELDYERTQSYDLIVRATDSVSGVSAEVPVSIMILDVNDCPPEIEQDIYNISVSEGSPFGTSLLKINARDNDTGINKAIAFSIDSNDQHNNSDYFHLDPSEGILYLKKSLDHEMQSVHHFTVIVTDGGSPPLSSTAHVWVFVIDINDNAPRFEEPSYSCQLSVHAKRGQFVTAVRASDPDYIDHSNLLYKIAQGNDMQTYDIDPSSGVITLINMKNFAEHQVTTLNVSVTDGIYTSFTRVKINILPGNLNSPMFEQLIYEVKLNENQLAGRHVATVSATDKDFGEFGTFTYDIMSDTIKEYFLIDKTKGIIETKTSLDREVRSYYEIPVVATDNGGRSGYATVKVKVIDENDNPPLFVLKEYHAVINGNFQTIVPFLKVKAFDKDDGDNKIIRYSMYEPENYKIKSLFDVHETNGSIFLTKSAANYVNQVFEFFVRASDRGTPSLHSDVPVTVRIVNNSITLPAFEQKERNQFISELSTPGTLITKIRLIGNFTGKYKLISGTDDNKQFSINDLGELTLAKTLDREQKDMHIIGILVEVGNDPSYTIVTELTLQVQDENDNAPIFESNPYSLFLAENVEKGTSIVRVIAHDADYGSNGEIRYFLADDIGDTANVFDVDVYAGWITTLMTMDREKQSEYRFQVIAADHGQAKHLGKTTVIVKLRDYNDNSLAFKLTNYTTSVAEDSLPGTVLLQLFVTDKDTDANSAVEYYIVSGDPLSQFHVRKTGDLFIAKPLDREQFSVYLLNIIATDGKYTASTNVTIIIKDVNDNPPYCPKYRYKQTIDELVVPGTFVLQIIASDADEESNSKLRFYLTGNGSDDFILDKDNGVLKTARALDRETVSRYFLTAHVQDRDQLSWECMSKIEIAIADVNDNAPTFSMDVYTLILPEDAEIGTLATKVHATDRDVGVNRKIIYSFLESGNGTFKISEDSGIITLKRALDRESIATYNLSVVATDQGTPKLYTVTTLIINVQDINDNPPEFTMRHYFATVAENVDLGHEVIKVLATSRDTGVNAEIYYSIIGGNEQKKFVINRNTGVVTISGEVDYEKTKHFFLTIQAVDGGVPPLSNLATLNITITDVNDNNPQFLQNSYIATIREDALVGDKILQVKAIDADSEPNGRLIYNIERGDRFNQFQIDKDTGYLSVAGTLDRESISSYVLEIRARDNGTPELSNYVHVNVDISDANDNPPLFTQSNYTVIVQEDKELGHVLIKFDIIDADTTPNSAPYTFDFRSGNDGGAFRLEQDGTLRTATRFNHKVRSTYTMLIRVFDNGTPPLYSDAWVTVKVIEESQYPPVITPVEILINSFEDEFPGGPIGRIYATDQDQYDSLVYNLVHTAGVLYSPHTLFNISKEHGFLHALPNLDVGDYRVNITVSDGKFTAFAIIKITVDLITKEMLENAVILRFNNITPEDFILSHRKGFIRSIRTAMRTRQKDIVIIAVQSFNRELNEVEYHRRSLRHSELQKQEEGKLDVVFTVRKQQVNPNTDGYFSSKEIMATISDNIEEIEEATNLIVDELVKTKCNQVKCVYGICKDKIILDRKNINTIATDVTTLVSTTYEHVNECKCQQGYGGKNCDEAINSCASKPCPLYKLCLPEGDMDGYRCVCPHGYAGPTCDRDVKKCLDYPCYNPISPVSFSGKSYAHYKIDRMVGKRTLEDQLIFSLRVRTLQQTGNLMYASGKVDYNILEISNGIVQYRFDLGSGEGLISVSSIYVSDGEWHEIKLERERNSAKLIVDGKHVAQGSAPGVNGILNLQSNDIFMGAEVRPHPAVLGFEDIQRGFVGCMDDIRLARESVPLHMTGSSTVAVLKRFANVEFTCDSSTVLVPLGICGTQPCFNGGICKNVGPNNFECQCHSRFTGPYCKDDLDPCASSPCLFGGKCQTEGAGNYSCNCPSRMSGKRCEFGRFCSPNPCKNGGVCEEGDYSAHCMCRGYTGATCEIDVDECENQPCGNGATCINEAGSFRCICPPDLTGASCGDPLYSNSITTQLRNLPLEDMIGIACAIISVVLIIIGCLCYFICSRKSLNHRTGNVNNHPHKEITLNPVLPKEDYKRSSKLSNLEVQQRPQSYTASSNDMPFPTNTILFNNLDFLKSYGSAGDELENVPPEYQKLNTNQHININGGNTSSDVESIHKQTWSDQMQLKTFSDNKLNNERKVEHTMRLASLKPTAALNSKPLHVNVPNINNSQSSFEDSPHNHGQYHWDCSDWARRSQNPLPDITEVPGVEVPDSSSFHSNESNESHPKCMHVPLNIGPVDPIRDIETLNEDVESEYVEESEYEGSAKPFSMSFETHMVIPGLNSLDSGSDEYRCNTGDTYHRHPNTYLPSYNIQSETDGETSMSSTKLLNSQIGSAIPGSNDSDEEEISGYGFPNRRIRREISDIDFVNKCGPTENMSLLGSYHPRDCESNSDLSTHICEIEDSEFEDTPQQQMNLTNTARNTISSKNRTAKKSVNWSTSVHQTDV